MSKDVAKDVARDSLKALASRLHDHIRLPLDREGNIKTNQFSLDVLIPILSKALVLFKLDAVAFYQQLKVFKIPAFEIPQCSPMFGNKTEEHEFLTMAFKSFIDKDIDDKSDNSTLVNFFDTVVGSVRGGIRRQVTAIVQASDKVPLPSTSRNWPIQPSPTPMETGNTTPSTPRSRLARRGNGSRVQTTKVFDYTAQQPPVSGVWGPQGAPRPTLAPPPPSDQPQPMDFSSSNDEEFPPLAPATSPRSRPASSVSPKSLPPQPLFASTPKIVVASTQAPASTATIPGLPAPQGFAGFENLKSRNNMNEI